MTDVWFAAFAGGFVGMVVGVSLATLCAAWVERAARERRETADEEHGTFVNGRGWVGTGAGERYFPAMRYEPCPGEFTGENL